MANRRDQIRLTEEELSGFLDEQRVIDVCTLGSDGWPHVTALWYVMRDGQPWIYTYRKSQKVKNLERDSRATLLVEDGEDYNELRGVMLKTNATVHDDFDTVAALSEAIFLKYQAGRTVRSTTTRARRCDRRSPSGQRSSSMSRRS